jgi:hypothetical protein
MIIGAWLVAPLYLFAQDVQVPAWRCMDEPGQGECQEALINDIEDIMKQEWPTDIYIAISPIPYRCSWWGYREGRFMRWFIRWTGKLRSFLIDRDTVYADLAGEARPYNPQPHGPAYLFVRRGDVSSWPNTTVDYNFEPGAAEVQAPGGPTGVRDLGRVRSSMSDGEFWSSHLHIRFDTERASGNHDWHCLFGPPGTTVAATESETPWRIELDYPIAWTLVQDALVERVRAQFRCSVQRAVTGVPCHVPNPDPDPDPGPDPDPDPGPDPDPDPGPGPGCRPPAHDCEPP